MIYEYVLLDRILSWRGTNFVWDTIIRDAYKNTFRMFPVYLDNWLYSWLCRRNLCLLTHLLLQILPDSSGLKQKEMGEYIRKIQRNIKWVILTEKWLFLFRPGDIYNSANTNFIFFSNFKVNSIICCNDIMVRQNYIFVEKQHLLYNKCNWQAHSIGVRK